MIERIEQLLKQQDRVIVSIDGCAAAGKTTLANDLARHFCATVIHMDDFFLPPELRTAERYAEAGGNIHYERFIDEVLFPIKTYQPLSYRKFDCHTGLFIPTAPFYPEPLIIIEGAYCLHPKFGRYYDLFTILTIPPEEQKRRLIARNGEQGAKRFETLWIPLESAYLSTLQTIDKPLGGYRGRNPC